MKPTKIGRGVSFYPHQVEALEARAKRFDLDVSWLVRRAVDRYLELEEGSGDDLPATNGLEDNDEAS